MLGRPLFSTLHLSFPRGSQEAHQPDILDIEEQAHVIAEAESLVAEEMRLGAMAADPSTPSPIEQTLKAVTVTDYGFSVMSDGSLLSLPIGPITTLSALSIDGDPVDLTRLEVKPWTIRYRDGTCFEFTSSVSITATIGWDHPGSVPFRVRSAVQLLIFDLAALHDSRSTVVAESADDASVTYARPSRDRVHKLIARLVEPWSRPPAA